MGHLLAASLIWAVSFGLVQHVLVAPGVSAALVAFFRLALSFLALAPWLRIGGDGARTTRLALVGAVQYGVMYLAYTESFRFLPSHLVALCTVLTPLYVVALHDAWSRRFGRLGLLAAGLAAVGAAVALGARPGALPGAKGFLLVQTANLAFAAGQVAYRRWMPATAGGAADRRSFAILYLAGALVAFPPAAPHLGGLASLTPAQWLTLAYLGLLPSGLGFYLWNRGVRLVPPAVAGVMNNAKVPLGILSSVLIFGEPAEWLSLCAGSVALALAAWVTVREDRKKKSASVLTWRGD
jgi:drug/metabolite transporter (DMT)-like permease